MSASCRFRIIPKICLTCPAYLLSHHVHSDSNTGCNAGALPCCRMSYGLKAVPPLYSLPLAATANNLPPSDCNSRQRVYLFGPRNRLQEHFVWRTANVRDWADPDIFRDVSALARGTMNGVRTLGLSAEETQGYLDMQVRKKHMPRELPFAVIQKSRLRTSGL